MLLILTISGELKVKTPQLPVNKASELPFYLTVKIKDEERKGSLKMCV